MEITVNGEVGNLFRTYSEFGQLDYEGLITACGTEMYTDDKVIKFVANEFGFDPEKIKVYHWVPLMAYVGGGWKCTGVRIKRHPAYNATDWNYMLFSVNRYVYEVVNGNLHTADIEGAE